MPARQLVAAGVDVIVGGHAHRLQGVGRMGNALVGYGLGNFVGYGTSELSTQTGVPFVTVTGRRVNAYRWMPTRIVDGVPRAPRLEPPAGACVVALAPPLHGPETLARAAPHCRPHSSEGPGDPPGGGALGIWIPPSCESTVSCGSMSDLATPSGWTTPRTVEAVALPRRHALAIAILTCVPLPLFSLAAIVIPLPQILERAAATFIPFAAPVLSDREPVLRERAVAVRSLEIRYDPLERDVQAPQDDRSSRLDSRALSRGAPARGRRNVTPPGVHADGGPGQAQVEPVDPGGGAGGEPDNTGSGDAAGGSSGAGDAPTSTDPPSGNPPTADPPATPPSSTPPAPGKGGGTEGGSPGAGGTGGSASSPPGGGGKGGGASRPPGGGGTGGAAPRPPGGGSDKGGTAPSPPGGGTGGGSSSPPGGGSGSGGNPSDSAGGGAAPGAGNGEPGGPGAPGAGSQGGGRNGP